MTRHIFIIVIVIALFGCAGSPARISMMSAEELKKVSSHDLCFAYESNGSEKAETELKRRGEITSDEWRLIKQRKIKRGMSELALVCSWGGVGLYGAINKSVGAWGERKQWVFRPCRACGANYVYTRNGVVDSWQN